VNTSYGPLRVAVADGVVSVTIDHEPSNLVDGVFVGALIQLLDACDADDQVRVLVFSSADRDFFLMHGDVEMILAAPAGRAATTTTAAQPNVAAAAFDRLRTARYVTMVAIDGAARGGGAEFCTACDVRYGTPRTLFGQPEVPMGILPGAGGTARLPRLLGRSRALELVLTGRDVGADEALALGWLTAVVPVEALAEHVDAVARRIAAMPAASVAAVKRVMDASLDGTLPDALATESAALSALEASGGHRGPMTRFLAAGGQTRDGERDRDRFGRIVDEMLAADPGGPDGAH
jgi:enoyl-CoA hydratase/carnithine racemase